MAKVLAEIAVYPLGTESTSISDFVAASDEILQNFPNVRSQINAMSTVLEGELNQVLQVIEQMHEAPFRQGTQRVVTSIRIDDRRDKASSMERMAQTAREKAHI